MHKCYNILLSLPLLQNTSQVYLHGKEFCQTVSIKGESQKTAATTELSSQWLHFLESYVTLFSNTVVRYGQLNEVKVTTGQYQVKTIFSFAELR